MSRPARTSVDKPRSTSVHRHPVDAASLRDDILTLHRKAIIEATHRRNFHGIALVGSVARGESGTESDVDFLVECDSRRSTLFGLSGLVSDLRELLGVDVDVVPKDYVRPGYEGMFEDAIPL